MKKIFEYRFVIALIVFVIVGFSIYTVGHQSSTINAFYENNCNKITSIEVFNSSNGNISIKDKEYIDTFSKYLSQMEVKKVNLGKQENTTAYRFLVYEGDTCQFDVSFSNSSFCTINNVDYQIISNSAESFEALTNTLSSKYLTIKFEYEDAAWDSMNLNNETYTNKAEFESTMIEHILMEEEDTNHYFWYKDFGTDVNTLIVKIAFWPGTVTPMNRLSYYDDTTITSTINLNKVEIEKGSTSLLNEVAHVLLTADYYSLKN